MTWFDGDQVEDLPDLNDPLPAGTYKMIVSDTDYRTTKRGDGKYMAVGFAVVEGPFKNRWVFDQFNLENPSAKAQQIGRGQFKRFLQAAGCPIKFESPYDFYSASKSKVVMVELEVEPDNMGKERNRVKKYSPISVAAVPSSMENIPF